MSTKRPPAPAPALPGFTFLDVLGSGGFADVYLYEQHLPRRKVAVKVLLPEKLSGSMLDQFTAEANVMALLSTHPAIATIYQAGVSDDQRPYLAMEYCPKPNLQVRSRQSALPISEALRVGIQVAAAVETAHRAGILHRDIKPANILVTEYNRPALTDFGIATTADDADPSTGMSIPWSPPESFADAPVYTARSDVYALGATLYTLLAGRSPFEVPGGRNGGADLIQRIESTPLVRLDRADAPESLQIVLDRAMSKRAADRYDSAVAFARALQKVQIELAHSVTPIDILDDAPDAEDEADEDGELTRVRGIVSIEPHTNPEAGRTRDREAFAPTAAAAFTPPPPVDDDTLLRAGDATRSAAVISPVATADDAEATILRPSVAATTAARTAPAAPAAAPPAVTPPASETAPAVPAGPRSKKGLWIGVGIAAAAVLVVAGVVGASLLAPPAPPTASPEPTSEVTPQDPSAGFVPAPADLTGTVTGAEVTFTWTNPDPQDGDGYVWYPYTLTAEGAGQLVSETSVTLPADPSGTTCISVSLRRADARVGDETRGCTP
ncbi:serine/threonine protein kinase [Microbacterium sp. W1N]|uniref:serine/threonine-protein kinase n=1 Tax=Microbacterium festucae TaxID=2977531 RepID=UPI0021C15CE6|nr:serine/threonine-protein kinase [Microbacterium festucae]MCT9819245.1 serine/threonine protein kinase [Microbacterium festucae]